MSQEEKDSYNRKKIDYKIKLLEKRDKFLKKDRSSERAVVEEVFDQATRIVIFNFLKKRIIDEIHGVVNSGKESRIYWGLDKDGNELAVKVYLTSSAEFRKGMVKYIEGDPRFKHIRRGTRPLIYLWAKKEFKNLHQARRSEVKVPTPIAVKKNVLLMEFIGKNGTSAPLLKNYQLKKPQKVYHTIIEYLSQLYQRAKLVHGDISEYNIMIRHESPVIFDMSQSVSIKHPLADTLLYRDIYNLNRFFTRQNVDVLPLKTCYEKVTGFDRK